SVKHPDTAVIAPTEWSLSRLESSWLFSLTALHRKYHPLWFHDTFRKNELPIRREYLRGASLWCDGSWQVSTCALYVPTYSMPWLLASEDKMRIVPHPMRFVVIDRIISKLPSVANSQRY